LHIKLFSIFAPILIFTTMRLLEGKTALITGASRGIGKSIAYRFALEGADIAITNIADDEDFQSTVKELGNLGVKARGYVSNAANFEDSQRVINEVVKDFTRIDILVNNAGITKDTLLMRMTEDQWDAVITVNLKSVFNLTKAVLNTMLRQKSGSIINMSSVVGVSGNAGQSNYSASKAGILGFTKSVAKEVGSRNIRCNAIAPGFIITEMTGKLPEDVKTEWANKIPLRRGGTPEDVANTALFLASDLSSYVTGQTIHVCGGMLT
jgi:3-oxoacyl-[acyl-carrier protein] reductase